MTKRDNQPDEIIDGETVRRAFAGSVVKNIDSEKRQIEFIISNASVDRYGDIVEVPGWDLKNYKNNPVVLFGHMSSIPPIGKAIKVWKDKDALRAIAEFIPQDISAFAHSIFRMYEEKFLRAVSVGFRPLKWERIVDEEGNETWAYRFKKQELLEFSAVPIPANPEALVAARQKGIDTAPFKQWAEEMLDRWNETEPQVQSLYGVNRKEMETIRRRASGAGSTYRVPPEIQDEIMKRNLKAIRAAKAKKTAEDKNFKKIKLLGIEYELPMIDTKAKDFGLGKVEISTDEIDGKKTFHVDKADDKALFTVEGLKSADLADFMKLTIKTDGDEASNGLILTMSADDSTIQYNLVGATEEGDLYGVKISEKSASSDEDDEEEKTKKPAADDEDDEDKAASDDDDSDEDEDKANDDDEDDEDKASDDDDDTDDDEDKASDDGDEEDKASDDDEDDEDKAASDDDDEDEKPKKAKKPADDADDEDDKKAAKAKKPKKKPAEDDDEDKDMDFNTHLHFMNGSLAGFEDALDKNGDASHTRREQRGLENLASYMRELADRLDGGKGIKGKQVRTLTKPAVQEEDETELTEGEAQAYLKQVTESLQPLLTEIVASKISKLRGRLD